MVTCKILQVKSAEELENHFRIRWQVFGEEEHYFQGERFPGGRETDEYDARPTTVHFNVIVVDDAQGSPDVTVGASRLILPDRELAAVNGWRYGLPLEKKLIIAMPENIPPNEVCEAGRLCFLKAWRSHLFLLTLLIEMCEESLRRGIKYWLAVATAKTASPTEAVQVMRTIEALGLTRVDVSLQLREPNDSHDEAMRGIEVEPFPDVRHLPPVVSLDARLGGRYFGRPIFDTYFGTYAIPLVASVQDVAKNAQSMMP